MKLPWWMSMATGRDWTSEEQWARGAIYVVSTIVFLFLGFSELRLLRSVKLEPHIGAVILLITCVPPAFWFGRQFCTLIWRELVTKADADAAKRLGTRRG